MKTVQKNYYHGGYAAPASVPSLPASTSSFRAFPFAHSRSSYPRLSPLFGDPVEILSGNFSGSRRVYGNIDVIPFIDKRQGWNGECCRKVANRYRVKSIKNYESSTKRAIFEDLNPGIAKVLSSTYLE